MGRKGLSPAWVFVRAAGIVSLAYALVLILGEQIAVLGARGGLAGDLEGTLSFTMRVALPIGAVLLLVAALGLRGEGAGKKAQGRWNPEPLQRTTDRQLAWAAGVLLLVVPCYFLLRSAGLPSSIKAAIGRVLAVAVSFSILAVIIGGALRISLLRKG